MHYVISDLHGYPHERFLQLLKEAGFGKHDFLYILGDVVDRNGDGGVETLEWLMYQTNVQLILGNHEAMLLANAFVFDEITDDSIGALTEEKIDMLTRYQLDGGDVTLKAMKALSKETQQDILDYLRDCPLYETISAGGRDFILVHSGFENFDPKKRVEDYAADELLWAWPELTDVYYKSVMTVLGHTPTLAFGEEYADKIIKTDTWIDIDMGAGFGHEPVLLRLDDMKEFRLSS
ncbi:MAG: metallophosphoesterase [Clostridiales bacterium]|nr:metallophosphoesterase [Clostridiales bacterium]